MTLSSKNSELDCFTRSWRRTRRAAQEILTKVAVCDYHPVFFKEAILLSTAMLKTPTRRTSTSNVLPHPPPCLYYMTIPPLRMNKTRTF